MTKRNTKEIILKKSIDLFAEKGYDNVSVREIAKASSIKESSIYNHYKSKQQILDTIFEYLTKEMLVDTQTEQEIENIVTKDITEFYKIGSQYYENKLRDPTNLKIFRILFIELYHNSQIKNFIQKFLIEIPIQGWTQLFSQMMENNLIRKVDSEHLANTYFKYGVELLFEIFLIYYPEDLETHLNNFFIKMENHMHFLTDCLLINE